jgi:hypothetical protein
MQPAASNHRGRKIDHDGATRATGDPHAVRVRRQDRLAPAIGRSLAPALASAATDNDDEYAAQGCSFSEGTNTAGMPDIADRQNGNTALRASIASLRACAMPTSGYAPRPRSRRRPVTGETNRKNQLPCPRAEDGRR